MAVAAKSLSTAFMLVLAAVLGPESLDEFRVDLVGSRGYSDTMIIRRIDGGFEVYDEMNGKLKKHMTIKQSKENPNEFTVTDHARGGEETVDLGQAFQRVDVAKLRESNRTILKLKEGGQVRLDRSGKVLFLSTQQSRLGCLAVHCYPSEKAEK